MIAAATSGRMKSRSVMLMTAITYRRRVQVGCEQNQRNGRQVGELDRSREIVYVRRGSPGSTSHVIATPY